jgi:hypothetical protein
MLEVNFAEFFFPDVGWIGGFAPKPLVVECNKQVARE